MGFTNIFVYLLYNISTNQITRYSRSLIWDRIVTSNSLELTNKDVVNPIQKKMYYLNIG